MWNEGVGGRWMGVWVGRECILYRLADVEDIVICCRFCDVYRYTFMHTEKILSKIY